MSEGTQGAGGASGEGDAQGGAAGEGQGGAAGLLNGGAGEGQSGGGEGGTGEGGTGEGGTGGGTGGGADWLAGLSDTAEGDAKSNRKWAAEKGYKNTDAAVQALRSLESRFLSGDKLVVPKDGDPPEVAEAFYKAIGRPDAPDGYEVAAPEGQELDAGLVEKLQQVAFDKGVPAEAFAAMAEAFNEHGAAMLEQQGGSKVEQRNDEVRELRKDWGDNFDRNIADANRAARMLGLDVAKDVAAIEDGYGTKNTLELMAKLGRLMGEDVLDGEGRQALSMSKADAQAELDAIAKDPAKSKAIMDGDKQATERRKHLLAVVAAHEDAEQRRAQAG